MIPKITRKSFEKFGFSTASLVVDWARIAGPDLASWTEPERVRWPQMPEEPVSDGCSGSRTGATLTLRVDPARALDVSYQSQQILERINAYFGYRAIAHLRVIQAPMAKGARQPDRLPHVRPGQAEAAAAHYGGDPLGQALSRLEAAVRRERGTGGTSRD